MLSILYFGNKETMIRANIQALVVFSPPSPSAVVLSPADASLTKTNPDGARVTPVIPIWVGTPESAALSLALDNHKNARPSTHDLLLNSISTLDALVKEVHITQFDGRIFYAELVLTQYERELILDSRPSDAIILATRENVPIFVKDELFEQAALPLISKKELNEELKIQEFHDFLENLSPGDFSA